MVIVMKRPYKKAISGRGHFNMGTLADEKHRGYSTLDERLQIVLWFRHSRARWFHF
jgi:hypothetical protein